MLLRSLALRDEAMALCDPAVDMVLWKLAPINDIFESSFAVFRSTWATRWWPVDRSFSQAAVLRRVCWTRSRRPTLYVPETFYLQAHTKK